MCIRDQAFLYYRLLQCGTEATQKVLQGRRSDPSLGVLIGRPAEPISQWAFSFNTLEPLKQGTMETEPASRESPEHVTFDPKPNTDLSDTLNCCQVQKVESGSDTTSHYAASSADVPASSVPAPLILSLSPALSPEEFEHLWLQKGTLHAKQGAVKMEESFVCLEEWVQGTAILNCSPQSLQAAMQLVNIQTLAFTPPHTLPWRVYLYTYTQCTHATDTPDSTLILGELLYTGKANARAVSQKGVCEGEVVVGGGDEVQVKDKEEVAADGLNRRETVRKEAEEDKVKVTLKQQPRDDKALKGFLSILTTVLNTLS